MRVIILQEELEMEKKAGFSAELFKNIDYYLEASGFCFSHLVVDGQEIIEEIEDYLTEHLDEIQVIEVKAITVKDTLDQALISAHGYLEQALPEISQLADSFYQGSDQGSWERFGQMLEGLQWILQVLATLERNKNLYATGADLVNIKEELRQQIMDLQGAVERKDFTLVGDIISFEILTLLQKLDVKVEEIMKNEVLGNEIN